MGISRPGHTPHGVQDLFDRSPASDAQVVEPLVAGCRACIATMCAAQRFLDVDVVADAGGRRRGIVGAEDGHLLATAKTVCRTTGMRCVSGS